jgi:hypothetical protein
VKYSMYRFVPYKSYVQYLTNLKSCVYSKTDEVGRIYTLQSTSKATNTSVELELNLNPDTTILNHEKNAAEDSHLIIDQKTDLR